MSNLFSDQIYAKHLKPGMTIKARGLIYFIEGAEYLPDQHCVRLCWHVVGQSSLRVPISVNPMNIYSLVPDIVIEEEPG